MVLVDPHTDQVSVVLEPGQEGITLPIKSTDRMYSIAYAAKNPFCFVYETPDGLYLAQIDKKGNLLRNDCICSDLSAAYYVSDDGKRVIYVSLYEGIVLYDVDKVVKKTLVAEQDFDYFYDIWLVDERVEHVALVSEEGDSYLLNFGDRQSFDLTPLISTDPNSDFSILPLFYSDEKIYYVVNQGNYHPRTVDFYEYIIATGENVHTKSIMVDFSEANDAVELFNEFARIWFENKLWDSHEVTFGSPQNNSDEKRLSIYIDGVYICDGAKNYYYDNGVFAFQTYDERICIFNDSKVETVQISEDYSLDGLRGDAVLLRSMYDSYMIDIHSMQVLYSNPMVPNSSSSGNDDLIFRNVIEFMW